MSTLNFQIPDQAKFTRAFALAPKVAVKQYNRAMQAAVAELSVEAEDRNFLFITPRELRSGMLQRMFRLNAATGMRELAQKPQALRTEVFSTVKYADIVAKDNDFYGRILKEAKPAMDKHFVKATENTLKEIKKSTL